MNWPACSSGRIPLLVRRGIRLAPSKARAHFFMSKSEQLFRRAQEVIPGGVNSPVRAFRAVGGQPLFIERGAASHIWDAEGREFIDYVGSWGPLIFGHRPPEVVKALGEILEIGTSFGAPTEREVDLAELITKFFPSVEKVRLVNSGTEATMSAIRLARGFTSRERIIKFDGCYHGHGDSLLVKAGSGVATLGLPDSPGVPQSLAELTTVLPFNDSNILKSEFDRRGNEIAGVIIEPVAGNMGCVPPRAGYLELLRDLTKRSGTILIFDEVMTGFRVARGGAQQRYGIQPDLTTMGKVIGGGLPVGAYGGRAEIMNRVAPAGPVYQAGTLSGNPLAVAAGLATLRRLEKENPYDNLESLGKRLERGLIEAAAKADVPARLNRVGSMFTLFFTDRDVIDFESAKTSETQRFNRFFHGMLNAGVYWPPSQFEAAFISAVHTDTDIDRTIEAATKALKA
jgi:glutamate-1-semialdehyde 2,1-aminomutase